MNRKRKNRRRQKRRASSHPVNPNRPARPDQEALQVEIEPTATQATASSNTKKRRRKRRVHVPGGTSHVRVFGNNREPLFRDDEDRPKFESLVAEGVRRFGHKIHGFKFMDNHVHLVIQVDQISLSVIMHNLCLRYARWFNARHGRTGHLFGRRYGSILIQVETFLLGLVAFLHHHGVRSGQVTNPANDTTCSHPAYLGVKRAQAIPWLTTEEVLARLNIDEQMARRQLGELVARPPDPSVPYSLGSPKDRRFLGDEGFIRGSLAAAGLV
jgi:putative transposase